MKRLLQLSLALNVALLVVTGWRGVHETPLNRVPRSEVGQPLGKRGAHRPARFEPAAAARVTTPWAAVENADPRQWVANLRALGCPERTIRDIVVLRLSRAFRERLLETESAFAQARGVTRGRSEAEWQSFWRQQRQTRNAMIDAVESALDENWQTLWTSVLGWPHRWDDPLRSLSVEKRRGLRELNTRYDELKNELQRKAYSGELDAEDSAALRELERQRQTELAALLSPEELRDYLYHKSAAADYVRGNLPEAKSESEFRKMVDVARELQMGEPVATAAKRIGVSSRDPDVLQAETERKAALDQRLKEVLGEARIAEQLVEEEQRRAEEKKRREAEDLQRELVRFTELATSVGIAEADAKRFFDRLNELRPVLEPQFEAMEKSLTGTEEEKRKQMDAYAKAMLGKLAIEVVGDKGTALIEKMANPGK